MHTSSGQKKISKEESWKKNRTRPSLRTDHEAEVQLCRTHTLKTSIQPHETGPDMEPSGGGRRRKRDRSRNSWRWDTTEEIKGVGMTQKEAERTTAPEPSQMEKCHR
jgi:hypothetical protein